MRKGRQQLLNTKGGARTQKGGEGPLEKAMPKLTQLPFIPVPQTTRLPTSNNTSSLHRPLQRSIKATPQIGASLSHPLSLTRDPRKAANLIPSQLLQ